MTGNSMVEDELLCDVRLVVFADFVGMNSRGSIYWQCVHASFHEQKNFTPTTCTSFVNVM